MNNNVSIFQNEQFGQIRTIYEMGKIYFCGKDIASTLGYVDTVNAIKQHCKEKGVVKRHLIDNMGRNQNATFIDEGNLYRLITHSKLPEAEKFESWIFDEVLPSLRQNGNYTLPSTQESIEGDKQDDQLEKAKMLLQISETLNDEYQQLLHAWAVKLITGEFLIPLPSFQERRTFSARDVANTLGTSPSYVGKLANRNGLKNEAFGKYTNCFRYFENAIYELGDILERKQQKEKILYKSAMLKFKKEEVDQIPQTRLREQFHECDDVVRCLKYSIGYELRFVRRGFSAKVFDEDLTIAKEKFLSGQFDEYGEPSEGL